LGKPTPLETFPLLQKLSYGYRRVAWLLQRTNTSICASQSRRENEISKRFSYSRLLEFALLRNGG
jgi:hypothetical protein